MLQEALFGAIMLVDYPFFNPACGICLCNHHLNTLASTWLFVANRVMQLVRNNDNQTKVVSYMKAFTKYLIHSQLRKWSLFRLVWWMMHINQYLRPQQLFWND